MKSIKGPELFFCEVCQTKSTVKEAFIFKGKAANGVDRCICFECEEKRKARNSLFGYAILLVWALFFWFLPETGYTRIVLGLALVWTLFIPLVFLHELSHALVAGLVGVRVFGIRIGIGRLVGTWRMLGMRWHLHAVPVSGVTYVAGPQLPFLRLRLFLIYLAGPGLHAVLAVVLGAVLASNIPINGSRWPFVLQVALIANLLLLLTTLFPKSLALPGGGTGATDGLAMFKMLTARADELKKTELYYYVMEVIDAIDRGNLEQAQLWAEKGVACCPDKPEILNAAGVVHFTACRYDQALTIFRQILAGSTPVADFTRYTIYNNIASCNYMLEDETALAEADTLSDEAVSNAPWISAFRSTRGAVLVWKGEYEQGISMLKSAMQTMPEARNKANSACSIAIGEARRGNQAAAHQYLSAARKLDPSCPLISRAQRELK